MKKIILVAVVLTFILSSCASSGNCGGYKWTSSCPAYR